MHSRTTLDRVSRWAGANERSLCVSPHLTRSHSQKKKTQTKMGRRRESGGAGNLSNEEKLRLCEFSQQNPTMNQKDLGAWAQRAFDLAKAPCQSTISNTLKKRQLLQAMKTTELVCKRRRVLKHPELDRALGNWVLYCLHKGLKVSGDLIKKQAATFATMLNSSDTNDMAFSNGWLSGFQDRHGIKNQRKAAALQAAVATVENGDDLSSAGAMAAPAGISPVLTECTLADLQVLANSYQPRDVYHMDEFGLFYDMPLDRNVFAQRQATNNNNNTHPARLTIAVAVNGDGSDKTEPLFVGKATRPTCFKGKLAHELGFVYESNQKGWMNGLVFQRWLQVFNGKMRDQNRQVVLLLDSAASHVTTGLVLTHVKVAFLAAKGSAKLQPLNGGIVKGFKRRYRHAHLENALGREEQGRRDIYTVNQLEAMEWSKQCWADIPAELIQNCWRHTRILGGDPLTAAEKRKYKQEDDIEEDILKHIQWLRIANPFSIDEMLNPPDENNVHSGVSAEDFIACAIEKEFESETENAETEAQRNGDGPASDLVPLTNEEKLEHLSYVIRIMNEHESLDATKQELRKVQRAIRDKIVEERRLARR